MEWFQVIASSNLGEEVGVGEPLHRPPVLLHLPHRRRQPRQQPRRRAEERRGDGVDEAALEGDARLSTKPRWRAKMLHDSRRHGTPDSDGKELARSLAARSTILIRILPLRRGSAHGVDVTDYSDVEDQMVKVSFVLTVSILAPIQVRRTVRALFGSGGGA